MADDQYAIDRDAKSALMKISLRMRGTLGTKHEGWLTDEAFDEVVQTLHDVGLRFARREPTP